MSGQTERPAIVVVHDDSVLGRATVEAMKGKKLSVRETDWAELSVENALGIVTIPPVRGETSRQVVLRARHVLDAAEGQGARLVQCHHPGALGRHDGVSSLDAGHRGTVDSDAFFYHEYLREMEIYRYIERGVHVVPVVIGFCVETDGANDWNLREGLREWSEYLHLTDRRLDVSRPTSVASGIVTALQQARPGRRVVFGGSGIEAEDLSEALGISMRGPIPITRFRDGVERLSRIIPASRQRLYSGIEPLVFGTELDSTRARGELGYMPRSPIFD